MTLMSYFLVFLGIICTGFAQILLKKGAKHTNSRISPYLNVQTISGYFLFFIVTICAVFAMIDIPLKLYTALTSLNFIIVFFLSVIILKEKYEFLNVVAVFFIVAGIIIFNI